MTPKLRKHIDKERQDNFSCKHENTRKSMQFLTLWKYFWSLTVYIDNEKVLSYLICFPALGVGREVVIAEFSTFYTRR